MATMESRKVQKTGGGTYVISLPKDWARSHQVKEGVSLRIIPQADGGLLLLPASTPPPPPTRCEVRVAGEHGDALARKIIGAYVAGYDIVEVRASSGKLTAEQIETVRTVVRRLVGTEIVEENPESILVQDLLDPVEISIRKALKRMRLLVDSMLSDTFASLAEKNPKGVSLVQMRDDEVDRLYMLVVKQYYALLREPLVGQKLGADPVSALADLMAARMLERIGDHAEMIAKRTLQLDRQSIPEDLLARTVEVGRSATSIVRDSFSALTTRDFAAANHAIEQARALRDVHHVLLERVLDMEGKSAVALATVLESIERVATYGIGIAEMAINQHMAIEKPAAEKPVHAGSGA